VATQLLPSSRVKRRNTGVKNSLTKGLNMEKKAVKTAGKARKARAPNGKNMQQSVGGGVGLLPTHFPLFPDAMRDMAEVLEAAQENGDCPREAAAEYLQCAARGRPDLEALWVALAVCVGSLTA